MVPDHSLYLLSHDTATIARPQRIARIARGTPIAPALRIPCAHQTTPTAPADQETTEQIRMLGIIAPRPLTIALQLHLRQFPGLRVDQHRHPDGNPLLLRAPHPRAAVSGALIFQPPLPVGTLRISRPRAVIVPVAFIDRVAQDFNDTALPPPAAVVLARRDPLQGEALVDGVGAELFLQDRERTR